MAATKRKVKTRKAPRKRIPKEPKFDPKESLRRHARAKVSADAAKRAREKAEADARRRLIEPLFEALDALFEEDLGFEFRGEPKEGHWIRERDLEGLFCLGHPIYGRLWRTYIMPTTRNGKPEILFRESSIGSVQGRFTNWPAAYEAFLEDLVQVLDRETLERWS